MSGDLPSCPSTARTPSTHSVIVTIPRENVYGHGNQARRF